MGEFNGVWLSFAEGEFCQRPAQPTARSSNWPNWRGSALSRNPRHIAIGIVLRIGPLLADSRVDRGQFIDGVGRTGLLQRPCCSIIGLLEPTPVAGFIE